MTSETPPQYIRRFSRLRAFRGFGAGRGLGGLVLLAVLAAAANIVVVQSLLHGFNDIGATVNVAGRLRMLSQKVALDTADLSAAAGVGAAEIERSMAQFDMALLALTEGGAAFGLDIRKLAPRQSVLLDAVRGGWDGYRADLRRWLALAAPGADLAAARTDGVALRDGIRKGAMRLLENTEALLGSIIAENRSAQQRALRLMYVLLLADALALAAAFAIARRQMAGPLRQLAHYCGELAAGNYNARIHYRFPGEMGRLARAFNDAAERIGQRVAHIDQDRRRLRHAEAMFRGIAENTMVGVYIVKGGRFRFVNATMADMFHYDCAEMLGSLRADDIFLPEERSKAGGGAHQHPDSDGCAERLERRGRRKDGSVISLEVFGSAMRLDGEIVTLGIAMDITARKEVEASLRMAALVYENSSEAMVVTDPDGCIVSINPAFSAITGYAANEMIGGKLNILSSGRHDTAFYDAMWHALNNTGKWQGEIWNRRKNGEEYAERLTINTSYNYDGSVRWRVGLFYDITKKKQADAFIWRQANYDHLTGLPNRQLFRDRLDRAIGRSNRSNLPMALVFLDLDFFKDVNDTLGHGTGDELLKQVAKRLSSCVRATDTVARLGGDEFTIIVGEVPAAPMAEGLFQQILHILAQPYCLGDEVAHISTSMGVTFYPADGGDAQELLKNADLAMYAAKASGRNQFRYFTRAMQQNALSRRELLRDLAGALDQYQFVLHYQPIVELGTGRIGKAEALIRWMHPDRGLIGPAEFIPLAEDAGIIVHIGDWVFREAARQAALWRGSRHADFQISVNVSPAQVMTEGVNHHDWLAYLEALHVSGHSIVVEITERLLMDANAHVTNKLLAFRDAGIQVALDDFGTGYSSLSYLKKFDIDYIKIDQTFVRNLGPDNDGMALCEAIIVMAHKLGLKVIAEGVETMAQRDLLMRAGCDYGQGYLFSAPLDAERFSRLPDAFV